jgi:hypothetical protein
MPTMTRIPPRLIPPMLLLSAPAAEGYGVTGRLPTNHR